MDCPACHTENDSDAATCTACGRALRDKRTGGSGERPVRRSGSRRRHADAGDLAAMDGNNPAAHRAFHMSIWSFAPGLGLILGPAAMVLGYRAARGAGDDRSGRNRARSAVLFGAVSTLTQWLGVALIYSGWGT